MNEQEVLNVESEIEQAPRVEAEIVKDLPAERLIDEMMPINNMQLLERRYKTFEMLKNYGLKTLSKGQVVDYEGKPYITAKGKAYLAGLAGIEIRPGVSQKQWMEDNLGQYYVYIVHGTVTRGNETIQEMGACSSRNPMWGKRHGEYIPYNEVNEVNVMKHAIANFRSRALGSALGIAGMGWEDLQKYCPEMTPENCGKNVKFKKEKSDPNAKSKSGSTFHELRESIRNMILELCGGDQSACKTYLEKLTTFEGRDGMVKGKSNVEALSDKQVEVIYGKLKKTYKEHTGQEYEKPMKSSK